MNYFSCPGLPKSDESMLTKQQKIEKLFEVISRKYETSKEEILSRRRFRNLNEARSIICYILHKVYNITQEETGDLIDRDHSTVRHLAIKVSGFIEFNKEYERKIAEIIHSVR